MVIVVARFDLPDRTLWIAESATAIAWAAGSVISAGGGLVVDEPPRLTIEQDATEAMQLSVVGDPIALRLGTTAGAMPGAMKVEVALWEVGTDWDTRETLIQDARATRVSQSIGDGGAMTLTVTRNLVRESLQSGEDYTIADSYLGRVPLGVGGEYYDQGKHDKMWPIALGPCLVPLIRWQRSNSTDWAFIVGHHLPLSDLAVYNDGQLLSAATRYTPVPVNTTVVSPTNNITRRASYIEGLNGKSSLAGPSWENEDGTLSNYTVNLTTYLAHGGDVNSRGEVIIGAGMILEHCLTLSGLKVDWDAMAPALARLQSWDLGVYIDGRAEWMAIIRERLLPILPLREHQSDSGVWYSYHVPWERTPRGTLTEGVDLHFVGEIEWDMEVVNTVVMRFAYRYGLGDYSETVTVGPDQSAICAASASSRAYGPRPGQPVNSTVIQDRNAAIRAGLVLAEANALPRRTFSAMCSWSSLRPGDTVKVDSTSLGGTGILCQVMETPRRTWPGVVLFQTVPRTTQATPGS
jgi:hypothetical protein